MHYFIHYCLSTGNCVCISNHCPLVLQLPEFVASNEEIWIHRLQLIERALYERHKLCELICYIHLAMQR